MFAPDEIKRLLDAARAAGFRNYAVVDVLLDSGVRRGELVGLVLDDVNVVTGRVYILCGKGGKSRHVRVGAKCRKVLWRCTTQYRKAAPGVDSFS